MTEKQRSAYKRIVSFLDNVPSLALPQDLKNFLTEHTEHMGTEQINEMITRAKKSIENPTANEKLPAKYPEIEKMNAEIK